MCNNHERTLIIQGGGGRGTDFYKQRRLASRILHECVINKINAMKHYSN